MHKILKSRCRQWIGSSSGVVAIMVALSLVAIVALVAIVVDVAYIYNVHRQLQAATDAAATAGGQEIYTGNAVAVATAYSATTGNKNLIPGITATMVSGYPQLKCLTSTGVPCYGTPPANALVVKQQAAVPVFFARIFGIGTVNITTQATVSAAGSEPTPYHVMFVLDTTASMNNSDSHCSIPGATRIVCAKAGLRTFLMGMSPTTNNIGLMAFPGVTSATVSRDYDCSSSTPTIVSYRSSPTYQILDLSNDFKVSYNSTSLTTTSNIVRAAGGGGTGCSQGIAAVGGVGTFYADAITAAQNALVASSVTGTKNVLVLLSDGDANASSSNMPTGRAANQCKQAVDAASAAAAAGTLVYSIAYGASTSTSSSCSTDIPYTSACATMRLIASDPNKFFSDNANGCSSPSNSSLTELVAIFGAIETSLTNARIIPDDSI